jgi:hypothetical protein
MMFIVPAGAYDFAMEKGLKLPDNFIRDEYLDEKTMLQVDPDKFMIGNITLRESLEMFGKIKHD